MMGLTVFAALIAASFKSCRKGYSEELKKIFLKVVKGNYPSAVDFRMEQTGSFLIKLFVKAEGMHRK